MKEPNLPTGLSPVFVSSSDNKTDKVLQALNDIKLQISSLQQHALNLQSEVMKCQNRLFS